MPIVGFKSGRAKGNSIQGGGFFGQFTSQSIRGGGSYGVFTSQSIQGGGSVSGVTVTIGVGGSPHPYVAVGFFFKVSILPSSTSMILHDINMGASGYYRSILKSTGHVSVEASYAGQSRTIDLCPSAVVIPGVWYWVSTQFGGSGSNAAFNKLRGQLTKGDGSTQAAQSTGYYGVSNIGNGSVVATLGLGVSLSNGSGYINFPNTSDNELSKLQGSQLFGSIDDAEIALWTPPSADQSPSGFLFYYTCRDSIGTTSGIVDSTTNAFNLTPGANGLLVVTDGPYP